MRTHYCGELTAQHIDSDIIICGWVHNRRDHGGVVFLDMRDVRGIAQVVCNPNNQAAFAIADKARCEFVLQISGRVRQRPAGTVNAAMHTGEIEVEASTVTVLAGSKPLPFPLDEHYNIGEEIRLQYRFLDLRRPEMQKNFFMRHQVMKIVRSYLDENAFIDLETPMLTRATPEGARDYLVPSRTHPHHFFALPQSPQLFKQLLMAGGFDRYYQIVKCFRDEDLRADRQPEFTQIDIEASFVDEATIMDLTERMLKLLFSQVLKIDLPDFPRISYQQALELYGSDKPDLRISLQLVDVADDMKNVAFKVFSGPANDPNSRVAALKVPGGAKLSRSAIDEYTKFVSRYRAKGLAYIKVEDDGLHSPILKFLPENVIEHLRSKLALEPGDIVFFGADKTQIVNDALGALRTKIGMDLGLIQPGWQPLWVTDFPMFDHDVHTGKRTALHHPFTAPIDVNAAPDTMLSRAYDIVINGVEIGGGSMRIHTADIQETVLGLLGINQQQAQQQFGFLLTALEYGCPPHGGIALGLDRLIMMMCGSDSIRDVITFPKTQSAACLLTKAPGSASKQQLQELHLRLAKFD